MKEVVETNPSEAQKAEMQIPHADLKIDREKEDFEDTRSKISSRMLLKEKCQMTDQKRMEQLKTHRLEMEAVLKEAVLEARAILSSDDARDRAISGCALRPRDS